MKSPRSTAADDPAENPWIEKIQKWQDTADMRKWRDARKRIRDIYRYENSAGSKTRKYALLWSNMETMKGATYAKPPKAEVVRRFRDKDDTARQASTMVERCINFTFDAEDYDGIFQEVRDDYLLDARGVCRVVYEPVMEIVALDDDGLDDTDAEGVDAARAHEEAEAADADDDATTEILTFERVKLQHVEADDFAHNPARKWSEVKQVAFRSYLDRGECVKRFGKKVGNKIQLTSRGDGREDKERAGRGVEDKAEIWEVWDKTGNRVLWVSVGYPNTLEEGKPYLTLDKFFPCPRPAYGTLGNKSLAPRPDYVFYQDQAEEINALTARIASLQDSLKIVGFYPAGPKGEGTPEVERAVKPGVENKMIAITGWENFLTKGGGKAPIVFLPVAEVGQVLEGCVKLRQQLIEDVNSIYGLTDIMRGAGDVNETATAQTIKTQYGSLRIRNRQAELSRLCRDVTRLVGEVICNHFQPETIMSMSNMPLPTDAEILAQLQAQAQAQAMQQAQAQAAAQQQQAMMGHNGGPPMGAPPQPQPGAM